MKTTVKFSLNQPKNMKATLTILGLALLILPAQGAALNTYPETNAAANVQLLGIVTNADGSFTTVRVPSVGGTDPAFTSVTVGGGAVDGVVKLWSVAGGTNWQMSVNDAGPLFTGGVQANSFNAAGTVNAQGDIASVFGVFKGNASGLVELQATNVVGNALPAGTLAITNRVSFAAPEVVLTNSVTFVGATNPPPAGWVAYVNVAVWGNGITVGWPAHWSPSGTNSVTLTNGLVAFRAYGTNITAAYLQP
jgi:hypothetical protein